MLGAPVELADGSLVRIRQGDHADRELLLRGFERLSEASRRRRFLAPMPDLTEDVVRHLTALDHHDHEAMIAIDEATGEGVGVARFVRDAGRHEAAEVAVTVVDDWQRRGLGTILLTMISARARQEGVRTFTALMLAENQQMMDLFEHLGQVRIVDQAIGTVEIELMIPPVGVAPALRKLLRVAAVRTAATRAVTRSS